MLRAIISCDNPAESVSMRNEVLIVVLVEFGVVWDVYTMSFGK